MKIQYRKPDLIEQMLTAIETAKQPIETIILTQTEFQSIFTHLHKTNNKNITSYSFRGIPIKVADE